MMTSKETRTALIVGATGSQGGATARALLALGWQVRALTRNPSGDAARALEEAGAAVVEGDLDDENSLRRAFEGADAVFAVTDWFKAGLDKEIAWGKRLADVAKAAGTPHFVYSSVISAGDGTGVPHFESKWAVEQHIRALGIPATILRPAVFMEDLTEKKYVPPANWGLMPRTAGADTPIPWVALSDIGRAAAAAMHSPQTHIGQMVTLVGDVVTMRQAREKFGRVAGRKPFALPMPVWLFRKMVSEELVMMWRWLGASPRAWDTAGTKAILPDALDMERWLASEIAA